MGVNDRLDLLGIRDSLNLNLDAVIPGGRDRDRSHFKNALPERLINLHIANIREIDIVREFGQDSLPQGDTFIRDRQIRPLCSDPPDQKDDEPNSHEAQNQTEDE